MKQPDSEARSIGELAKGIVGDLDLLGRPQGMTEWEFRQAVKDMIALYGNQSRAVMETTIQQELDKYNDFHV